MICVSLLMRWIRKLIDKLGMKKKRNNKNNVYEYKLDFKVNIKIFYNKITC